MLAALVRRGNMAKAQGQWQEGKAVRKQPHSSYGPTVTLTFASGPVLRLHASANVPVLQTGRRTHR